MKRNLKLIGLAAVMALCLLLTGCYQPPDEVNNGGPTGAITASFFNTLAPKATSTPVAPDTVVVETTNPNIGVVGNQETPIPTSGSSIGSAWDNWGSAPTDVLTPTPDGYTGVTPAPTDGSGNITVITTAPPTAIGNARSELQTERTWILQGIRRR